MPMMQPVNSLLITSTPVIGVLEFSPRLYGRTRTGFFPELFPEKVMTLLDRRFFVTVQLPSCGSAPFEIRSNSPTILTPFLISSLSMLSPPARKVPAWPGDDATRRDGRSRADFALDDRARRGQVPTRSGAPSSRSRAMVDR